MTFWLAIVGLVIAACLTVIRMTLSDISGGMLRKLEERDPNLAEQFEEWLDHRDRYRITIRIILLADVIFFLLCGTAWLQSLSADQVNWHTLLWKALVVAAVYLLVTEWLGQDMAKLGSRFLLRITMPTVRLLAIITYPLAYPIARWHRFVREHRELTTGEADQATTEDEIMSLVEQDEQAENEAAALEADERRMIKGIFDLDETLVREIMTPRVDIDAVSDDDDMATVQTTIVESGHTRIPVYHDTIDHILGILHAKDLLAEANRTDDASPANAVRPAVFIPESKNVADLLQEFQQRDAHFGVVVDEYGGTAGIVTLEDVIEEIVGEIHDEYDLERRDITVSRLHDGGLLAEARTPIHELNDLFELDIPEDEDFDTLGGFIAARMGHIPEPGEVLENASFRIEILEADQRRVLKAKILHKEDGTETTEGDQKKSTAREEERTE
ncbi:MAG: hemolysin family protein [Candidatus Pacebacteria bacterium]|nr:hemolysin family protein [Candidatus Paceibacterota bacterium]